MLILSCSIFHHEINKVIERERLSGIKVAGKRSHCGHPPQSEKQFLPKFSDNEKNTDIIPLGNYCTGKQCEACETENRKISNEVNCYSILVPDEFINYYIGKGYYIISSGWLNDWEYFVKDLWGFNESNAKTFFKDSANKIMLFDTGVFEDTENKINAFAEFSGLEYDHIHIGLSYLTSKIKSLHQKYTTEKANSEQKKEKDENRKQKANNLLIFNFINQFNDLNSEEDVITSVLNLTDILFSPGKSAYFAVQEDQLDHIISVKEFADTEAYFKQCGFKDTHKITESGNGFIVKISFRDHEFGYLLLEDLLFPDYLNKYIQVVEMISTTTGMFLANVVHIRKINEAKDIAEKNEQTINEQKNKLEENNEEIRILLESLEEKNAILQDLNASKDKLFSIIGHDIKNPFSSILGFAELLKKNYSKLNDDDRIKYIDFIDESSKSVFNLLENLLEWAQVQRHAVSFSPREIQLSSLINDTVQIYIGQAKEKEVFLQSIVNDDIKVFADKEMLRTIIRNLIGNAIKYTSANDKITIDANYASQMVEISVSDTGIGMDESTRNNLFKIGETESVHGTGGESGTGLGLIISKEFVNKHGGKIKVESIPGVGSKFKFTMKPADN